MKFCRNCGTTLPVAGPPPMGPMGSMGSMGGPIGPMGGPGGPPPMGPPGAPPLFGGGPGYPPPNGPPPGFPLPPGGMGGGPPPGYPGHHPGHNPGIPPSMAPGGAPLGPPGPPPPMPGAPPAGAFGGPPGAGFAATVAAPTPSPIAAGTNAGPADGPGFGQASQPGLVSCPRCNAKTPGSFAYCQQCGLHLPAVAPTDPGGAVRAGAIGPGSGGVVASAAAAAVSSSGPSVGPSPSAGLASAGGTASGPGSNDRSSDRSIDPQGATMAAPADVRAQLPGKSAASWGTAVLVNRDGSDGERFPLAGEYVDIGRAGTTIAFEQDRFLARTHARLERTGDGARIVCLDLLNGVFRKLELPVELEDGAVVLVGREVLRYERVADDERDAEPLVQHGVALFGSPPRAPWGRLSELLPSGGVRDVRNLNGEEVVIGREEGDLVFRDDAFMSRRHAAITWDGQRARLTDLGSSNGTFIRLSGAAALRHRDHLRMGDQLFRIELR